MIDGYWQKLVEQIGWWPAAAVALLLTLAGFYILKELLWRIFLFDRRLTKLLHQKKSSEVRLGKITEVLAPLMADFPVPVGKPGTSTVFVGQPVDYIFFDPEQGVSFIEVKSGRAQLSAAQKKVKELVQEGQVTWCEYKVEG